MRSKSLYKQLQDKKPMWWLRKTKKDVDKSLARWLDDLVRRYGQMLRSDDTVPQRACSLGMISVSKTRLMQHGVRLEFFGPVK
jgi:hypothetical protein